MAAIDALFDQMLARKGSDLHLGIGYPPLIRRRGELESLRDEPLNPDEIEELLFEIISSAEQDRIKNELAGVTNVVVRPDWQECSRTQFVEGAIARTLTGDIYRADDRAISSVNRELFAQQQSLAERIRAIKPHVVVAPDGREAEEG